jgi:hypothetical protein
VIRKSILVLLACCVVIPVFSWGFFAHKMINRLAVFTLPESLLLFYKTNIEYITEHAVDADMRRYSDPEEACRHYIDLDYYEANVPIDTVPKYWKDAVAKYSEDTLKAYGIVPWHINLMKYKLTEAFKAKDVDRILKISADIGHYIGDAHVPLHSTENYNGQKTNQHGIHGFWESRLPELFSDKYDFFVGRAKYIDNVQMAAWAASEGSYAAKDSVLDFERKLNTTFGSDRKYSNEQRGQAMIKVYSKEYSEAYHNMLDNQVERRIRASVLTVGSIWYTAWVDGGQPDLINIQQTTKKLTDEERKALISEQQKLLEENKMIGRPEN